MQRVQLLTLGIFLITCSMSYTDTPSAAHMCNELTNAMAQNNTTLAYELACKLAQTGHQQELGPMLESLCNTLSSEQINNLNESMQAHVFIEGGMPNAPDQRPSTPKKPQALNQQSVTRTCDELAQAIEQDNTKLAFELACKLIQTGHQQELGPLLDALCSSLSSKQMEQLNKTMQAHAFIEVDAPDRPSYKPQDESQKHRSLKKKYKQLQKELKVVQKESARELHVIMTQVQKLEKNLASRNKRVEQLELTLALSHDQNALPATITQLEEDLATAHLAAEQAQQEILEKNQTLHAQLEQAQQEMSYTKGQLEQMTCQAQTYATQLMATKDDNAELYTQLAELTKESEVLCRQLQESKKECSGYLKDLLHTQAYLDETMAAYAKQQHTSEQLADRLAQSTQQYHELAAEFDDYRRHNSMAHMNKFISKFKKMSWDKINELLKQKEVLLQEKDQLTQSFKQERGELLAECELYEEHLEQLWEQLKQEQQKTAHIQRVKQQELEDLQCQHAHKHETLSDQYLDLNEQYAELSSELQQQYAWDDQLEAELTHAKKEIGKLSSELNELQEAHRGTIAQMNELKHDKLMVTELYQKLIEENDLKDTHIAELSDKLIESQELWHQNEQLYAQLELKKTERDRFEQQCKQLVNELNQQKKLVQAKSKQHQEDRAGLEKSCNHYMAQLESTQSELKNANDQLAHLSSEIKAQAQGMLELQNDTATMQQTYDQKLLAASKDLEAMVLEKDEQEKTVSQLVCELEASVRDHNDTAMQLAATQKELDRCMQAYKVAQTDNTSLQEQAEQGLQKAMRMAQQKMQTIYEQSQSLHAELTGAQERQELLQAQLTSKSSLSDHLLAELQESKQHVTHLEREVEVHETYAHRLQKKLALVEQVLRESSETVAEHDSSTPQHVPA